MPIDAFYWLGSTAAQVFAALVAVTAVFAIFKRQNLVERWNKNDWADDLRRETLQLFRWENIDGTLRFSQDDISLHWKKLEAACVPEKLKTLHQERGHEVKTQFDLYRKKRSRLWAHMIDEQNILKSVKWTFIASAAGAGLGLITM